jgi:UDP-N-acetylmuramyl pentapeptide phosphotransferase/UDP-N-acetylglucosamine-1-phosphate transferase
MGPMSIAWMVLACVFGGALLGVVLRLVLPAHHLSADSKDVIKLAMGLTATMAALVLALLIAAAKSSYDAQRSEVTQLSANIVLLDRVLAHYGPETKAARALLSHTAAAMIERIWPEDRSRAAELAPTAAGAEGFYDKIQELSPQNEVQRSLQAQALKMSIDLGQTRWLLFEQGGRSIPMPFLVLLIFWVTIIYVSFGLFAPPNATVIATLFLCAL